MPCDRSSRAFAARAGAAASAALRGLRAALRRVRFSPHGGACAPGFRSPDLKGDDDHDYATRTGAYAYLRTLAEHEALMREGDVEDRGHARYRSGPGSSAATSRRSATGASGASLGAVP